jgi:peptidoglycan hydrolase-like protein with peptidoglycan-binding domain
MRRRILAVVIAVALLAGCDSGNSPDAGAQAPAVPTPSSSSAPSPAPSTSVSPTTPPAPQKIKKGAKGAVVVALQRRLTELGYWNGKADGKFGSTTQQAVFALQKTAGLGRDGVVGPKTQQALDDGVRPKARSTSGSSRVIEINLKKQLLILVDDGKITQVFNTSTGSNENYEHDGQTYLADTPSGKFRVGRQIDGWRHGPLGPLWRPKYFNGGIAVHGAPSVPPYAASHGCARLSIAAMNWIWANDKMPLKTRVWVYRG